MRKLLGVALVACLFVTVGAEDKKVDVKKLKCPISGKPCVANGTAEHNGNTIYFCCTNCPKAFGNNTAKFAAKANHQAVLSGQAKQAKCPFKLKPVNPAHTVDVAGVKVGTCWPGCKKKAGSAEAVNLIFNDDTFKKAFTSAKAKKG